MYNIYVYVRRRVHERERERERAKVKGERTVLKKSNKLFSINIYLLNYYKSYYIFFIF